MASGVKVAVALAGGGGVAAQMRTVARVSAELAIAVGKGVAELVGGRGRAGWLLRLTAVTQKEPAGRTTAS